MTVEDAEPIHGQEEEDGQSLLLEREVSRLRETVERLTKERTKRAAEGPKNDGEGQEVGITSTRGTKESAPGAPTGAIMGPPPLPPPQPWSASRRFRCPDELRSNVKDKETDRFGGPGPRDLPQDLKILFLRKLE